MSGQWTPTNPGAGSPADIRADAARRQTQASETRTAAGHVTEAGGSGAGWQGAGADALAQKTTVYRTELEILASQSDAHAAALQRYAGEVESIQQLQNTIAANQQSVAARLRSANRQLSEETTKLRADPAASPTLIYQLQNNVETLTSQASGLSSQLAALAQQRSAADTTAITGLNSAESRGGLAGILSLSGPASGSMLGQTAPLQRDLTLEQLAGLSEVELAMLFTTHPEVAAQIETSSSPVQVASWWGELSAEQQGALALGASSLIGSLGGVSPTGRVAANRVNAMRRLEWVNGRLGELESKVPGGADAFFRSAAHDEYETLLAEQSYLQRAIDGKVQLYLYDPATQSIVEMIGSPGPSTTGMTIYTPGTFTSSHSFYDDGVQQVGRWLNSRDPNMVAFVWKQGGFPGENPDAGSMDLLRILEANDESWALGTGELLADFQSEVHVSSPVLAGAEQVGMGHSWGLSALTASEVEGAHYDQVHSLAGAGMPENWDAQDGTSYYHWAYTDLLTMAQSTGAVWDGRIPVNDPAFSSHHYERAGDFKLYLPSATSPSGGFSTSPPPYIDASTNALDNHNLIASDRSENQSALRDILREMERERAHD